MALTKFYRINNVWHLGQYDALPSGCWSRTFNDIGQIVISLLPPYSPSPNGNMYATGYYSDFCDASGTAYATQAAFDEATSDFFTGTNFTSKIDAGNSTTTPLGANEVFTGEWFDAKEYGTITIGVTADVDSALNGLRLEYSDNKDEIVQDDEYTILGGNGKVFSITPANQFFRIRYFNGAQPQTKLCIQPIARTVSIKGSSHRILDSIIGDDDAELMKSVITGLRDDDVFGNVVLDNENRMQVSAQPYLYGVAEDTIGGHSSLLNPGIRSAILAATASTIWEGTTALYQYLSAASTVNIASSSLSDSSSGTGARSVTVCGLDASYNEQCEEVVMNGTVTVTTTKYFIRVFKINVETCGTSDTNIGAINAISTTGGIQLAIIPAGDGESNAAIFTVPYGKVCYITQLTISNDSGKGSRFAILIRQMDGGIRYPWRVKYRGYFLGGIETLNFDIPIRISAKNDIELRFLTDSNSGTIRGGGSFSGWYEDLE